LIVEFEEKMVKEDFWSDNDKAQKIIAESNILKEKRAMAQNLKESYENLLVSLEFAEEDDDMKVESIKEFKALEKELQRVKLEILLSGEFDRNNAILTIHPGVGGKDAQEWAEMLLRMYKRWSESKGFKVKTLDFLNDTEGGIKWVTLSVSGPNAYGYLKPEKGVHRLIRLSPFDSSGKRHTSFASVEVVPELDGEIEININPVDLRIDTYRSSGAGGQHVNTTDSAIRITHIPTGIVVQCQDQRSQHSNKEVAMKMLMAKLIAIKEMEHKEKIEDLKGDYGQITWGSQIRTYVFHPYTMVKDHRTNFEIGNVQQVLDGDLDPFINEYLKQNA
jgi:peptide chain release factor 2